jgi:hypothetical protein
MKAGRIAGAAIVVLFGCRGAFAEPCAMINRQIYTLTADTVNWSMRVGNDQNCRYGIRYAKVQLEGMTLVSPPRSGQVVLQGSAFTYVPKKDFQGDDSFDLKVAGQIQKVRGASTIHIVVAVRSATKWVEPAQAAVPAPTAHNPHQTVPVPNSGGLGPVLMPPALGAASGPVPQLGSGPVPVLMPQLGSGPVPVPTPQLGSGPVPGLMPSLPTASPAAPFSFSISPSKNP